MPIIRSAGRRAIVELKDELLPNTTYTIDFTDAIVDNNEGKSFRTLCFLFQLEISLIHYLLPESVNAEDLEP